MAISYMEKVTASFSSEQLAHAGAIAYDRYTSSPYAVAIAYGHAVRKEGFRILMTLYAESSAKQLILLDCLSEWYRGSNSSPRLWNVIRELLVLGLKKERLLQTKRYLVHGECGSLFLLHKQKQLTP